ncbi:MAG: dienelactone hydrolase family protein [Thermomonas hydrothermalis]|uniref:dienelactone hydrolase family protein n=1 Tax=Thermomonas hydrothermalis TaxID=213588 RepID=UPI0023520BB7|nr:dienelactone hydrolase family protein [Thermomonas hydrothermalis]MCL6618336.1 dienelactone hydrolase family protein [Thermomonas hydrothermalis]
MGDWEVLSTPHGDVRAWHAAPAGPARGGVVVTQEVFGITDHIRSLCAQLAQAGFAALAPAYFDLLEPDTVLNDDDPGTARGRALVDQLGLERALDVCAAAAIALRMRGLAVGALGVCWGGTVALLANTRLGLPAVSCYGARNPAFLDAPARAPLQFHFGGQDPLIPPEAIDAHRRKQPQAELYVYPDAGHAFLREHSRYWQPDAAALAWTRILAFFREHLQ